MRKKCPYSELFWSVVSRIWTEYEEILRISPYSVRMRENKDLNNWKHGHFSRRNTNIFWFEEFELFESQSPTQEAGCSRDLQLY